MENTDIELTAILDRNLGTIIDEFGLRDDLDNGKLVCSECDKVLTFENIGMLKLLDDSVVLFCDDHVYPQATHEL